MTSIVVNTAYLKKHGRPFIVHFQ